MKRGNVCFEITSWDAERAQDELFRQAETHYKFASTGTQKKRRTKMQRWRTHLTPADDVSIHRKHIDDLAFTLVTPLRSENDSHFSRVGARHALLFPRWREDTVAVCLLNWTLHSLFFFLPFFFFIFEYEKQPQFPERPNELRAQTHTRFGNRRATAET